VGVGDGDEGFALNLDCFFVDGFGNCSSGFVLSLAANIHLGKYALL
jgi:hypothetical protein